MDQENRKKYLDAEECKLLEFEFPVCVKSKNDRLFHRYGSDGRFEMISFGKIEDGESGTIIPNCSICFGTRFQDYHNNKFDKQFLNRIVELNTIITEDEFMEAVNRYMDNYKNFLNQTLKLQDTQEDGKADEEEMPF